MNIKLSIPPDPEIFLQNFLGLTRRKSKLIVFKILNQQNYFYYKEIGAKESSEKHKSVLRKTSMK